MKAAKTAYYVEVRCSKCKEEIMVRINLSSDFQREYNAANPEHFYTIKKEMMGKACFNLMKLTLGLTKNITVSSITAEACEFIRFDKE